MRQRHAQKMQERGRDRMTDRLTPEEKERFEAARKKALEDPTIRQLREKAESSNREFFEAMKAKMNEIDPGLGELLKSKRGWDGKPAALKGEKGKRPGFSKGRGSSQDLSDLSEGERQRLMAAREIAKQSPAVQTAEQNRAAASTKEERKAADEAFRKAMRDAVLQADPGLAPVLDKISPQGGKQRSKRGSQAPGEQS